MKKVFLLCFALFSFLLVKAQPWIENLRNSGIENPTFNQVRDAFYAYKATHPEMVRGEKQFKRWEYFWQKRVDKNGNFPSQDLLINEWKKANASKLAQRKTNDNGVWELLGPKDAVPSGGGVGRINCIAFDPINPNIIYAGSPAGGLWRTDDDGATWVTTTDQLPCIGVSDVVINPENRNEIYIATGDRDAGDTRSVGIFKSIDGGLTWNPTGLALNVTSNIQITKMIMHQNNPDTIVATTSNGIYRTLDGGVNWTKVVNGGNYYDLEAMPGSPDTLYACTASTVYKSVNTGATWLNVSSSVSFSSNRLMLAVTPANSRVVYAVAAKSNGGFASLYKSSNGGDTWNQQSTSPNILGWSVSGNGDTDGQGWYDLGLAVSPTNENDVYVGGVNIWRSTNGGVNWTLNAHWYGGGGKPYVHADIHYLIFRPGSSNTIYSGNDGGFFKGSLNGTMWNDFSAGLQVQQIYKMSTSQDVDFYVISGAQDNGTNLFSRISGVSGMEQVLGGDGMDCAIDPLDSRNMYGSLYYGDISRSTNHGASFQDINPPGNLEGAWVTPFALDPSNPGTIWIGYKSILRSDDMGDTWTDKTTGISNAAALGINGVNFSNIAVSKSDGAVVYASTDNKIFKTDDGGFSWSSVGVGLPTSSLDISGIAIHNSSADTVWVTFGGYTADKKVYKSTNGGLTWSNITALGLPNVPVNCIIHQEKSALEDVYVGTDLGVYYLNHDFGEWQPYNDGLPNTIVTDLDIQYQKSLLRASTYGRGLWEVKTLTSTLVSVNEIEKEVGAKLFSVYPNPSNGEINIVTDAQKNISKADVYVKNISGQVVKLNFDTKFDNGKATVNLKDLPKGVYTVTIRSEKVVATQKITIVN